MVIFRLEMIMICGKIMNLNLQMRYAYILIFQILNQMVGGLRYVVDIGLNDLLSTTLQEVISNLMWNNTSIR